jgi:hypothetical protein
MESTMNTSGGAGGAEGAKNDAIGPIPISINDVNGSKIPNRGKVWKVEERDMLSNYLREGKSYEDIGTLLGRTSVSIKYAADNMITKMLKDGKTSTDIMIAMPRFDENYINEVVAKNKANQERKNKLKEKREKTRKQVKVAKEETVPVNTPETSSMMQVDIRIITDIFIRLGELQKSIEEIKTKLS